MCLQFRFKAATHCHISGELFLSRNGGRRLAISVRYLSGLAGTPQQMT